MKYAVIALSGHQYQVEENQVITVDKLGQEEKSVGSVPNVLLCVDGKDIKIGQPFLENVRVDFDVIKNYQGKKLRVFKYKAKSRYRKTQGFRPQLTDIKITKIALKSVSKPVKKTTV